MPKDWECIVRESWKGKSIHRTLMNLDIQRRVSLNGSNVLDLGAGERPSYWRFIQGSPQSVTRIDLLPASKPDTVASLETGLPICSNYADQILLFNVLEHIYQYRTLLKEAYRVLKPQGTLFACIPFLFIVHSDPYDFHRYTDATLQRALTEAGFSQNEIISHSGLGKTTANFFYPMVPLSFIKMILVLAGLGLDYILDYLKPTVNQKYVLNYFFTAVK